MLTIHTLVSEHRHREQLRYIAIFAPPSPSSYTIPSTPQPLITTSLPLIPYIPFISPKYTQTTQNMASNNTNGTASNTATSQLPPEAIAFAKKMYDAARAGQMDIFEQALPAGLPVNMTNEKGDSLVSYAVFPVSGVNCLDGTYLLEFVWERLCGVEGWNMSLSFAACFVA